MVDRYVWVYGERFRWWPTPASSIRPESWPEAVPGCAEALRYARDPLDFGRTEIARLELAGTLVNLARNGDFSSSTACLMDGAEQKWHEGRPPAGWTAWQKSDSKGRFVWDRETGAKGKGAAQASHVAEGCFIQAGKAVAGQCYAVRAACKLRGSGSAWLRVRWQTAEGRWTAEGQDRLFCGEPSQNRWQELFGVVEVPEGVGRLVVLLSVSGQDAPEDTVWFDDVELYRLSEHVTAPSP